MAAVRRGQPKGPLSLDLPKTRVSNDPPPISALFLIYFDIKAGYTVGWKRSLPGIELEGVVEYKSLPSGLHTVKEDLIYFVHDSHAGLSAFVNAPAAEESRNARMIAVGVMVPLSYGRLGRAWKHAEKLKNMAHELIADTTNTEILKDFWEEHKSDHSSEDQDTGSLLETPKSVKSQAIRNNSSKPKGHSRDRSASDGTALLPPGHKLSAYHPAWSLPRLLETFGPLIFPIHRAALLRNRILITAQAPVEETCNFVYDLSVLSNIPLAISDLLSPTAPPQRLRPLFSIGVHDIPLLEEDLRASKVATTSPSPSSSTISTDEQGCGWIACTTDSILAMKSTLYDVLITMPPPHSENAAEKVWPKIESPQGIEMKATQRDLRRYKALRCGLSRHVSEPSSSVATWRAGEGRDEPPRTASSLTTEIDDPTLSIPDTDAIIEPLSWSALAYSGFMWWASAGEQRLISDEESEADLTLMSDLSLFPSMPHTVKSPNMSSTTLVAEGSAKQEMGIVAYFHRLTTMILSTLSDIIDVTDSDDEREDEGLVDGSAEDETGPAVYVSSADVVRMGLDVWSAIDHQFIEDITRQYFGRRAYIEGRNVDICGIRVC